jgi:homoserine dehydrogenase
MSQALVQPTGTLRVALLGCGVVGTEVAKLLATHADELAARTGIKLEIVGIAVRRLGRDRTATGIDPALFTTTPKSWSRAPTSSSRSSAASSRPERLCCKRCSTAPRS